MRNLTHLPEGTDYNNDFSKLPFGGIKNKTSTNAGTPVVEELIGDILSNNYRLLELAKIPFTGDQDNKDNGYQVVDALKLFSNNLNDKVPVLTLDGSTFRIPINLTLLPDSYPIFVKASDNYVPSGNEVVFRGNGTGDDDIELPINPISWVSGNILLLVINADGVNVYNISNPAAALTLSEIFPAAGTPLSYNDDSVIWYLSEGVIFTDRPFYHDLMPAVEAVFDGEPVYIKEAFVSRKFMYLLCYAYNYESYDMVRVNMDTYACQLMTGLDIPGGADKNPYLYTDGVQVWFTNSGGLDLFDNKLKKFTINGLNLDYVSGVNLDNSFQKTTNAVVLGSNLYTIVSGSLRQFNLITGAVTEGYTMKGNIGQLFYYAKAHYHLVGGVAKKWFLPDFND